MTTVEQYRDVLRKCKVKWGFFFVRREENTLKLKPIVFGGLLFEAFYARHMGIDVIQIKPEAGSTMIIAMIHEPRGDNLDIYRDQAFISLKRKLIVGDDS